MKERNYLGLPVIIMPLFLYSDDTSCNHTKKWNKFDVWCVSLACLPREKAQGTANIFLLSASNRVSTMQMSKPIVDDILTLEQCICTYDSYLKTDVFVVAPVICLLCDNARASELLNHLGSTALYLCRMCDVSCVIIVTSSLFKLDL